MTEHAETAAISRGTSHVKSHVSAVSLLKSEEQRYIKKRSTRTVIVQAQQLKQQLRSAQVAVQWQGDTALTLPLFWRRSTVSPVFFGQFPRSSLHSVVHFPLCPRP